MEPQVGGAKKSKNRSLNSEQIWLDLFHRKHTWHSFIVASFCCHVGWQKEGLIVSYIYNEKLRFCPCNLYPEHNPLVPHAGFNWLTPNHYIKPWVFHHFHPWKKWAWLSGFLVFSVSSESFHRIRSSRELKVLGKFLGSQQRWYFEDLSTLLITGNPARILRLSAAIFHDP